MSPKVIDVTVYKNHEDTRESWTVRASDESGDELGSVQIRRLTENKAIGFIFGLESGEDKKEVISALVAKILENAPNHKFGLLQTSAIAGSINAEVLESFGFDPYARFVNPNTGNTLRLYGVTLYHSSL